MTANFTLVMENVSFVLQDLIVLAYMNKDDLVSLLPYGLILLNQLWTVFFDIWNGLSSSIYLQFVETACCSLPRTLPKLPSHCQVRQTAACLHETEKECSSEVCHRTSNHSCGRRTHACCQGLRKQQQSEGSKSLGARLALLCLAPYLHCWSSQFYHGYDLRNLRRSINTIIDTALTIPLDFTLR